MRVTATTTTTTHLRALNAERTICGLVTRKPRIVMGEYAPGLALVRYVNASGAAFDIGDSNVMTDVRRALRARPTVVDCEACARDAPACVRKSTRVHFHPR